MENGSDWSDNDTTQRCTVRELNLLIDLFFDTHQHPIERDTAGAKLIFIYHVHLPIV